VTDRRFAATLLLWAAAACSSGPSHENDADAVDEPGPEDTTADDAAEPDTAGEADGDVDIPDAVGEDVNDEDAATFPGAGVDCTDGEPTPGTTAALLYGAGGFAKNVTGGLRGCLYHVTTLEDSGPGSLRDGLEADGPLWIVFDLSGTITLASEIVVQPDKTVDGRGQRVEIEEGGLLIEDPPVRNVVVENVIFARGENSGDAVTIYGGASLIWIDHCAFGTWADGQVDITEASTDVTVSWSVFRDHGKVMLIGAAPESTGDTVIRVTVHHNWFDGTEERHPRLRFGKAHVFNNLYVDWLYYAIGSSQLGQVASEANIFDAGENKDAIIIRVGDDPSDGLVRSTGDLLLGGAVAEENLPGEVFLPADFYTYVPDVADDSLRGAIESGAGWRDVSRP
jgi:pectate lyase